MLHAVIVKTNYRALSRTCLVVIMSQAKQTGSVQSHFSVYVCLLWITINILTYTRRAQLFLSWNVDQWIEIILLLLGATARGGPWPPPRSASTGPYVSPFLSSFSFPFFLGHQSHHPSILIWVFLSFSLHRVFASVFFWAWPSLPSFLHDLATVLFVPVNRDWKNTSTPFR